MSDHQHHIKEKRKSSSHHSSSSHSSKKRHHRRSKSPEEDEWVEKVSSLPISSNSTSTSRTAPPIDTISTFTVGESTNASNRGGEDSLVPLQRGSLTDGYGEGEEGSSTYGGRGGGALGKVDDDLFSNMGIERKRSEPKPKIDPTQTMGQSSRELNKAHWQGTPNNSSTSNTSISTSSTSISNLPGSPIPGSSGSNWRMMKVRRTFETAQEENRTVEEVALERYDSIESWKEALEEKRILDERSDRRQSNGGNRTPRNNNNNGSSNNNGGNNNGRSFVFTDVPGSGSAGPSRPSSRNSFRKPGEALERTNSNNGNSTPSNNNSRPGTPIPNVFTPPISRTPKIAMSSHLSQSITIDNSDSTPSSTSTPSISLSPPLTQSELNKLQAKVLKAKLMGNDDADELEMEYEKERVRTLEAGSVSNTTSIPVVRDNVSVLPTLDGRGRLYDVGIGEAEEEVQTGKRKKKEKAFESHDPKTGELIRHNADDDTLSLAEMVRQERFSAGANDQKNMDYEMASRIAGDSKFQNNLDYADENAEKLARKKMKSDVMKKAFAVQDYAHTKKSLDNCTVCFGDDNQAPKAAVVALGTRAYLGLLETEELVPGHCRIVPLQHYFTSLDADDDTWDEIKNFMKTLMQMFAEQDKGVVFFESCISLKHQNHTYIEAIPLPFDQFDEIPAYFQEAIDNSEQEWSQHKKRIVFTSARPFRRSLVPNLPYFAVQWDYKGEKGFGHVIEGVDDAPDRDADGEEQRGETGDKGGGEFPKWFATEIIGGMLELEPRQWRKPRRLSFQKNQARVDAFRVNYDKYDWTKMLKNA